MCVFSGSAALGVGGHSYEVREGEMTLLEEIKHSLCSQNKNRDEAQKLQLVSLNKYVQSVLDRVHILSWDSISKKRKREKE